MNLIQTTPTSSVVTQRIAPRVLSGFAVNKSNDEASITEDFFDNVLDVTSGVSAWNEHQLQGHILEEDVTLENLTPLVAEIGEDLYVSRVAPGVARIRGTYGQYRNTLVLDMRTNGGATAKRLNSFKAGSIAKALSDPVVAIADPAKGTAYFSTYNHAGNSFVKNINCWAGNLDMTGVGLGTDIHGSSFSSANRGAFITSRHWVGVRHYTVTHPTSAGTVGIATGNKIRAIDDSGTLHERTVIGTSAALSTLDLVVATLDSPLPAGVTPLPIAGSWLIQSPVQTGRTLSYFASGLVYHVANNHNLKLALLQSVYSKSSATVFNSSSGHELFLISVLSNNAAVEIADALLGSPDLSPLYSQGQSGDSGGPIMVQGSSGPVLVTLWSYSFGGYFIGYDDGLLPNAMIASADADAVARGNLASPTSLTVTVAPDPTL